ncbi:hypothetical protein [Zobellia nedashkovskayae]|uniref:hypothetical protein n=1 Tax=Zobellia nedashkovskayae TaxID=2779510 RepID=UPI00188B7F32|nr:hypothetical protein [Zobellia nedashkovskayae]
MNLAETKIAVGINVDVFRGIVNFLYANETIPHNLEFGALEIQLNEPIIEIRETATVPRLGIHITGEFIDGTSPATEFAIWVCLQPFVRAIPDATPVAALSVGEVEEASPPGIGGIVGATATGLLNGILENMDIPIYDSLIAGLEEAAFGDNPPLRSTWDTDFYLGQVSEIEYVKAGLDTGNPPNPTVMGSEMLPTTPALMATLALPGESAQIPENPSIVPNGTGIQIMISRDAMDLSLNLNASSKIGTTIDGATINAMEMRMHDFGIEISGNAEKSGATVSWDGVLVLLYRKFYFVKSSKRWHDGFIDVMTSGIDVDVDLKWYVKLARAFLAILGPIGWITHSLWLSPKLKEADEAPDFVKGAFREEVSSALQNMIGNVGGLSGEDEIPFMDFGQNAWVLNGHFTHSVLTFAGLNRDTIANIEHDTFETEGAYGTSVGMIELRKGYNLHPQELGRLLKSGIVQIPNVHGVEAQYGFYVRTNPNANPADNLVDPAEIHTD